MDDDDKEFGMLIAWGGVSFLCMLLTIPIVLMEIVKSIQRVLA